MRPSSARLNSIAGRSGPWLAAVLALAASACALPLQRQPAASVELWRLDCGRFDVKNIGGRPRTLSNGCYLIRHGSDYLLWDVGIDDRLVGHPDVSDTQTISVEQSLTSQLAQIGVNPRQVRRLGVSHRHDDHFGQARHFPWATLLIGSQDWDELRAEPESAALVKPWISGGAPLKTVTGDLDLFGDGRVMMLATPGHTASHHALLVRLRNRSVLLTGDAVHFRDQLETRKPSGNHVDKVSGVESIDRMLGIAAKQGVDIIVQHDPLDIARLPTFPSSLK